ncbi:PTS transporter subunit IIC [Mycoplasmopsis equigenitalium]|uniref:Ascorbate-specific PTS system EIIC component n=1 Tax=Mycoplasmopsis equigenitalium TaxID=114883 RepID=A0ABY5J0Y8_9BACT|nr:PTS ascorbate transporter subunit IIC [Mycoplasmopsis equigenitalium]UUD36927.1 PTS transporter subunit IIC [Mycoplasmopsis equigenitalium]
MWFLEFLKAFIGVPAFLVGIFTLIGALIQRKKASQVTLSVFKVIIGFLILGGGAGVVVGSISSFQPVFQATFGLTGVIPNNDALAGALTGPLPKIVTLGSLIMIIGMILNMILAAFSRLRYVYLSGHVLYYTSLMIAMVFYAMGFKFDSNGGDFAAALISGSALIAAYMVIAPATQQRYMRMITGTDEIGLGHTGGFGYALSGLIGEGIGKLSKGKIVSTEEIRFPKGLYFLRNTIISLTISIFIFYAVAFIPGGIQYEMGRITESNYKDAYNVLSKGNWVITLFVQAFTFTAGVEILLSGVRLFVGELVPMFKGISEKLIKNSKAAVDCPVVFPYAPVAVLIGFLSSFVAAVIGMGITIGLNKANLLSVVILPGLVPHFFLGATSGVFGNVRGGWVGAIVGPFVGGIIITFVHAIFIWGGWVPVSNEEFAKLIEEHAKSGLSDPKEIADAVQKAKSTLNTLNWGDTDYIIGAIPGVFGKIKGTAGKWVGFAVPLLIYFGVLLDGIISYFIKKNKPQPAEETKEASVEA